MGLQKGQTNNPNGRPRGVKNRVTREVKQALTKILKKNLKRLDFNMSELDPKDHVAATFKLAEFIVPRKASMEVGIDAMSFDEKLEMIEQIIEQNESRQIQPAENRQGSIGAIKVLTGGKEDH